MIFSKGAKVMPTEGTADSFVTHASIFLRLNATAPQLRELAWNEFRDRYAPVIAGFARNMGARPQDIDDVIQDVMLGFFKTAPTFVYDPAKGRFRGFLKVCAFRSLRKKLTQNARFNGVPIEDVDPECPEVSKPWDELWDQQQLKQALDATRAEYRGRNTYRAFELNVILGKSAADVAQELEMSIDSVYKAKERVTQVLREKLREIQEEYG
jgi:RNA polymerase sigma-70 factor, ECF subfamily